MVRRMWKLKVKRTTQRLGSVEMLNSGDSTQKAGKRKEIHHDEEEGREAGNKMRKLSDSSEMGLGNPLSAGALSDWCWRECPNIVFLMETMICKKDLDRIRNRCGFTTGLCIGSRGKSGGMAFWWRNIDVELLSYNAHHVAVKVRKENDEGWWKGIGIYGWPEFCNKYKTWDMLRSLCYGDNIPTILFGDFNEILSNNEKEGGVMRHGRQMEAFRNALDDCALHDFGFTGNKFTWQRGKEVGRMIRERLDRAVANAE
ncbi:hypothetical protein RND81_02G238000 [Saponaria officinalis]|uniref:Uncharacterized protein n=1 Tax=Saponaria officinalis TaxID=3572 RepID=A0AAW1MW74_SAPOF